MPTIDPREVLVFLALPDTITSGADSNAVLGPDDLAHVARFHFERHREVALASRVVQRRALSACAAVAPDAWVFQKDENGRPSIASPAVTPQLHFSVANTRGLVACAVTVSRDVGLDVEPWAEDVPDQVVDRCFSPAEREALAGLPAAERPRHFVQVWALKEAYAKARGLGLSAPLDRISISLDGGVPRLTLDPSFSDDAAAWQLAIWSPTESHAVAVCVRRDDGPPLKIESRWLSA